MCLAEVRNAPEPRRACRAAGGGVEGLVSAPCEGLSFSVRHDKRRGNRPEVLVP